MTRLERADFYADWLAASERNALDVERSPIVARGRELDWIETPNEHRIAMLIGEQVGFPTNGTNLCKVVVPAASTPAGIATARRRSTSSRGRGFIVVAGRRYDSTRDDHPRPVHGRPPALQHRGRGPRVRVGLDDGPRPVRPARPAGAARGRRAPTTRLRAGFPAEDGQFDALGRRIALHLEDAPNEPDRRSSIAQAGGAASEHGRRPRARSRRTARRRRSAGARARPPGAGRLIKSEHPTATARSTT